MPEPRHMPAENETLLFDAGAPQIAILRLLDEMNVVAEMAHEEVGDPSSARQTAETLDKIARSMSSTLKCLSDLQAQNERIRKADEEKKFTRYEDLPPPSPEDRRRFLERLDHLVAEIEPLSDEAAAARLESLRK
ncbi:hypothetical protein [Litorimonas haliclonae]|uniref:hypothetical protein n=1 Tax=Litorimonas haliclonae TaxID=2081977 RepID=UPI0039EEA021